MQILPEYIASLNRVLENLLEELRLHIVEDLSLIYDRLDIYSLDNDEIATKIGLVGLDVESKDSILFTPSFYKAFRRLNVNRATLAACNFIAKTGGFLELTSQPVSSTSYSRLLLSSLIRDYNISYDSSDGYIYFEEEFKEYLTRQDLIYHYLPMGYSYVYLTRMYPRTGGLTGSVLPYWWLRIIDRDYGYKSQEEYDSLWRKRSYIDNNGDMYPLPDWDYSPWYAGHLDKSLLSETQKWLFHITDPINDYPQYITSEKNKVFWNIVINRDYEGYNQLNSLSDEDYYLFVAFYFVLSEYGIEDGLIRWRDMGLLVSGDVPIHNIMSTYESLGMRGISLEDILKERRRFTHNLFYNGRLEFDNSDIDNPDVMKVTSQYVEVDAFIERTQSPIEVEDKNQPVYMNSSSIISLIVSKDAQDDPYSTGVQTADLYLGQNSYTFEIVIEDP